MSLHIQAKKGEIAETVLMPGDPLRAKWIAETFFENPTCYNEIRGMLGYTGLYKGKKISVQGSGMGIPSAMIYYHELINAYEVKNIVRVGTAGSYQKDVKIRDVVLAMSASTTSGINKERFKHMNYAPTANYELLMRAVHFAEQNNMDIKVGNVLSSDEFY
ncbi:MAG: purine-nucleoside phosphorylase, partial [Bacteroidota bacterium]